MRVMSFLRAGMLAMALVGVAASVAPAFAQSRVSNTGPYDGPAFQQMTHNAESTGG